MQIEEERLHRITPTQESFCFLLQGFIWNGVWAFTECRYYSNGKREEAPPDDEVKLLKQSHGARQRMKGVFKILITMSSV